MVFTIGQHYFLLQKHFYNSENWTDTQKDVFALLYGLPPWKYAADYFYDRRKVDEFRKNYPDVEWHDPRNVPGIDATGNAANLARWSLNFVSKNFEDLYT